MSLARFLWLMLAIPLLLFSSCHDELELPAAPERRVVIVYMIAENSLAGFSRNDLSEIREAAGSIPDSCTLVVYIDDNLTDPGPRILTFDKQSGERTLFAYKEDPVSTDSTVMQQALDFIIRQCPARHYGLVLWSHGSGWIPQRQQAQYTIGVDNGRNATSNTGKELEIPTLARVLANTGQRWDYVFFDACFMQCVEVAYELRDVADWIIGSPAEIPGNGAPYDYIMKDLFADTKDVWTIARDYYQFYVEDNRYYGAPVLSCVNTAQLDQLADATATVLAGLDAHPLADIQEYGAYGYSNYPSWYPRYFDMGSAMAHWLDDETYRAWQEALERVVPYRYAADRWVSAYPYSYQLRVTDPEHIAGLSMYIPGESTMQDNNFSRFAWHKAMGWE